MSNEEINIELKTLNCKNLIIVDFTEEELEARIKIEVSNVKRIFIEKDRIYIQLTTSRVKVPRYKIKKLRINNVEYTFEEFGKRIEQLKGE